MGSTNNHGGDRYQGKGLDAGQGLPCRDWAGVLPTQTFLNSNLVTPETFIQFHPSVQKLSRFHITQTDTQTPYKTNHPSTLYGYGQNILYPIFSTSLKTE